MNDDIFVYCVNLPPGVSEMVVPCMSGYTIYIDESLSRSGRLAAYHHAIQHIANGDFDRDIDVDQIERVRHKVEKS